jgi:hypothetical protein
MRYPEEKRIKMPLRGRSTAGHYNPKQSPTPNEVGVSVDPIFGSRGIPMPLRAGMGMPAYGKFGSAGTASADGLEVT